MSRTKFDATVYRTVRVKVENIEANSPQAAAQMAESLVEQSCIMDRMRVEISEPGSDDWPNQVRYVEEDEETTGYLIDLHEDPDNPLPLLPDGTPYSPAAHLEYMIDALHNVPEHKRDEMKDFIRQKLYEATGLKYTAPEDAPEPTDFGPGA